VQRTKDEPTLKLYPAISLLTGALLKKKNEGLYYCFKLVKFYDVLIIIKALIRNCHRNLKIDIHLVMRNRKLFANLRR